MANSLETIRAFRVNRSFTREMLSSCPEKPRPSEMLRNEVGIAECFLFGETTSLETPGLVLAKRRPSKPLSLHDKTRKKTLAASRPSAPLKVQALGYDVGKLVQVPQTWGGKECPVLSEAEEDVRD